MKQKSRFAKKGQAAMEFLMSYGWAILVVITAIGALAYFGVLNPSNFLGDRCTLDPGFGCDDFLVSEDAVTLAIQNGRGEVITVSGITVEGCTGSASGVLQDGEKENFVVPGCNNVIGTKFRGQINVSYSVESGIVHTMFGELATKVESGNATSVSGPFTVAFRESGNEQNRTDDSQISADNPTTNYGALTTINVDGSGPHVHGLIRFPNIFGASQGQVPLGAQIQTATITIECFGTGHTMNAYRLLESWTESEVTWNERSTGTAWSDVGADGPGSRDTTAISWLCDSAGSKNYDMTSFVQSWSSGNPNYGVVITDSGNNGNDLYSNERATESERPLLTVTYTVTS